MAFTSIVADDLSIYAITGDGSLVWYRDLLRDGTNEPTGGAGWASTSGSQIGAGWDGFKHVFAGGDGIIYAIRDTGELHWYRDALRNGTNAPNGTTGWATGSGNQIGVGWGGFAKVFHGGNGIIYAIRDTGELLWFQDVLRNGTNAPDGTTGWAAGSGNQIGVGWGGFGKVFSGGNGVIYAISSAGELRWYRDALRNGTNAPNGSTGWAAGSGNQIGVGWGSFPAVFAPGAGDGIIYTTTQTSDLLWFQDVLRNGTNAPEGTTGWAARSGSIIGRGWSIEPRMLVTGYPTPLSVQRGGQVQLHLNSQAPSLQCTVKVYRLRENADGSVGVLMGSPINVTATHQTTPSDAWQNGCGWPTTVSVPLDPMWPSGLYSARVTAGTSTTDVVFVVRPGVAKKDLLLLANTNCWNAYNAWGGVSNYTGHADVVSLNFERPNLATAPRAQLTATTYEPNHLTAAEIWLSTWLESAGYQFDMCSDLDLHLGNPDINAYKGVVISTHPEYWSNQMAARLADYVEQGGRVLYIGGNGIFRKVEFSADGRTMTTGSHAAWFAGNAWAQGPKPRTLLGVAYDIDHDRLYPSRCGYVVTDPGHKMLAGTNLAQGSVIGLEGRNGGGACGWEVDTAIDFGEGNGGPPAGLDVIAHGQLATPEGYTGHMTYYENDAGGFVFAAGSITFGGSVVVDPKLQKIVRNALDACLAPTAAVPVAAD